MSQYEHRLTKILAALRIINGEVTLLIGSLDNFLFDLKVCNSVVKLNAMRDEIAVLITGMDHLLRSLEPKAEEECEKREGHTLFWWKRGP